MFARLILLIALLFTAAIIIHQLKNTPKSQQKALYWKLGLGLTALLLIILAVTGRISWFMGLIGAAIPLLRHYAPMLIRLLPFFQQLRRQQQSQQPPDPDNSSEVETTILRMNLNHANNELKGEVLSGPFAGRQLDDLELGQLQQLLDYCQQKDSDSSKLLLSYLQHRFGNDWQRHQPPASNNGELGVDEALELLGLQAGASREDIIAAHRRLMQKVHPDRGGSDYLAARVNQAKDILLASC